MCGSVLEAREEMAASVGISERRAGRSENLGERLVEVMVERWGQISNSNRGGLSA